MKVRKVVKKNVQVCSLLPTVILNVYYVCEQNVISVYFCTSVSLFDVELRI